MAKPPGAPSPRLPTADPRGADVPELPEVEVVRRGLERWVAGRTVASVEVHHPRAVRRHLEGTDHFVASIPTKPTTVRSSGTRSPRRAASCRTPIAITSLEQITAVGGCGRSSSSAIPRHPPSRLKSE